MKYYIQLEGDDHIFRFQKDETWRLLQNRDFIENDLLTEYESDLISLQKVNSKINLVDMEWKLNPTSASLFEEGILNYRVYAKRTVKPNIPSKEQLISIIASGDDKQTNILILNTNGKYKLISVDRINQAFEYLNVVVRNEAFIAGNEYVGTQASQDNKFIEDLYNESLEYWLIHLLKGKTNMFSDGMMLNRETSEIIAEIEGLKI
jgi:hypothetical protein